MHSNRRQRALLVLLRILLPQLQRRFERHPIRHIPAQRIVRAGLIRQHIRHHAALRQFRNHVRAIAYQPDGSRFALAHRVFQNAQRFVERSHQHVAVTGLQPLLDALRINVNSQERRAIHRGRQRLRSTHAAHAAADHKLALQVAAKMFFCRRRKRLVRSLQNSLRADVNPASRGHLPVHHQARAVQFVEFVPVVPVAYEVGIAQQHARRVLMRAKHGHRLSRLHQ